MENACRPRENDHLYQIFYDNNVNAIDCLFAFDCM